jgi:hypothetical protein
VLCSAEPSSYTGAARLSGSYCVEDFELTPAIVCLWDKVGESENVWAVDYAITDREHFAQRAQECLWLARVCPEQFRDDYLELAAEYSC